jgi:urea carboxylase
VLALEAMKMETAMTSPVDGEVVEVYVKPGEQVAPGQVLMAIKEAR